MVILVRQLRLCLGVLLLFLWTGVASSQPSADAPGHYFLVIDHSGSMLEKIDRGAESGQTRWGVMQERAADFVERLPAGSHVWVSIFSSRPKAQPTRPWNQVLSATLDGPGSREQLKRALRAYPAPDPANGTWLHQAIDGALAEVAATVEREE